MDLKLLSFFIMLFWADNGPCAYNNNKTERTNDTVLFIAGNPNA